MDTLRFVIVGLMFFGMSMASSAQLAIDSFWPNHRLETGLIMRGVFRRQFKTSANDTLNYKLRFYNPRIQIGFRYNKRSTFFVYTDVLRFKLEHRQLAQEFFTLGYGVQHQWAFRELFLHSTNKKGGVGKLKCYPIVWVGVNANKVIIEDNLTRIPVVGDNYGLVYEVGAGLAVYLSKRFQLDYTFFTSYSNQFPYATEGQRIGLLKMNYKIF